MTQAAQGAIKVLTTDIFTIRGRVFRKLEIEVPTGKFTKTGRPKMRKEVILEPVEYEAHANPVGIGILAGLGALGAALLFGRITPHVPLVGKVELYKGPLADEFDRWMKNRATRKCQELFDKWNVTSGFDNLRVIWDEATERGCTWHRLVPRP